MAKATRNDEKTTEAPAPSASARTGADATSPEPPQLVTFDRWFAAKKFKPHWKDGMMAFTNTAGRKSMDEWNTIFKKY